MKYRLGLDIGTNSIGWAVIRLNGDDQPVGLQDAGARIYSDGRNPKDKQSLAVARRAGRSMRRRRDRFLRRRRKLLRLLKQYDLLPIDEVGGDRIFDPKLHDPFEIRARGLDEQLSLHELGRAIFHLNQRRGFQSNRKSDKGEEAETGKIKSAIGRLHAAIENSGARTLGEYLHKRRTEGQPVRVRMRPLEQAEGKKPEDGYDFYPDRELVKAEFDALWQAQAKVHPDTLNYEAYNAISDVLFFQRPLRPVRPGKCTFNPEEERLPKAHPLSQRIRIFQEANNLRVIDQDLSVGPPLSREDRDVVVLALRSKASQTFGQLRKVLKISNRTRFNLESDNRKKMDGDITTAVLSDERRIGPQWAALPQERQIEIVHRLLNEQDEDALIVWLMAELKLSEAQAKATANAPLPDGYASLGPTATRDILAELEKDVVPYSTACERAGYHHSDFRTGEVHDSLPYYGAILERHVAFGSNDPADSEEVRLGRLANPTVHIGLNQLRRLVNALIRTYGRPRQIVVELARDLKLNKKQKEQLNKRLKENTDRAERHRKKLDELGLPDNGENRMRLRLWEELNPGAPNDRRCPYTLERIGIEKLFTADVDIDHIIPFSRSLDNSAANRTVCIARANKAKGNKTPAEFLSHMPAWEEILANAQSLPHNKAWRFAANAMERLEKDMDFIDRQLTDTQYLSRIAGEYLQALYSEKGQSNVWVTPGRLTAMLRRYWGLNSILTGHNLEEPDNPAKNRDDHRHHAIDAIVVALTDRSLLNRMSREAGQAEDMDQELMADVPKPWDSLRDDVMSVMDRIVISHRPDHGSSSGRGRAEGFNQTSGRLHNDTAYGIVSGPDKRGAYAVVHRVPFDSLAKIGDIEAIRDEYLKKELLEAVYGLDGKAFKEALLQFSAEHEVFRGIRHVRIVETLSIIPVKDKAGRPYKAYKGDSNDRFDVWRLPDGKWVSEIVSTYDANQTGYRSPVRQENPTAKKVLSLKRGDILAWEDDNGNRKLIRVVKYSTIGTMQLAAHNEAGNLKARDSDKSDIFRYINTSASGLQKHNARQVRVDELGRVFDPGPRF